MSRVFAALGRTAVRFRFLVVLAWLVAAIALTHFLPSLASVTKANNTAFLPSDTPSVQAAKLATPLDGSTHVRRVTLVAVSPGRLDAADQAALSRVVTAVRQVPTVRVAKEVAVAPDGRAAEVQVLSSATAFEQGADKKLVAGISAAISHVVLPAGLHVYPTGQIADQVASSKTSSHAGSSVEKFSVLFILVLLLLVFRAALAPVLTLLPAGLALLVAEPLIAESSKVGVPVSSITQFMLIVLMLGAGTDYGLFLVFRVREHLREGHPPAEAVVAAVTKVGESITFSALTVIGALLSLMLASFGIYRSLGAPLAIGIAVMLLAGLTLLPALLAIFGRAVFWPSDVHPGAAKVGWWGRVAGQVVRRPAVTLGIGLVIFGGLALGALANKPAGFGNALAAPAGSSAAKGASALAANFPKAAANPTNVVLRYPGSAWTDPTPVADAERRASRDPLFRSVLGPMDPNGTSLSAAEITALHARLGPPARLPAVSPPGSGVPATLYQAYRAEGQFISPAGHTVQLETTLVAGPPSSTAALQAVPAVRRSVAALASATGAVAYGVAGEAPGAYDVANVSASDLTTIFPIVVVIIFFLLALVLRSLVAPFYLVASVALSYAAALGLSVAIFMGVLGASGLTFLLPFLMFVFLLALGEDYNILIMTRIREESAHRPLKEAVSHALNQTGTTVTSAGTILAGTFVVLGLAAGGAAGGSEIRDIGLGLAFGILMDTFFVRTLLVPSTVVLVGRLNFWPAQRSRPPAALATTTGDGSAAGSAGRSTAAPARGAGESRTPGAESSG